MSVSADSVPLEKYRRSRRWNVVLLATVLFLGVVLIAQLLATPKPTDSAQPPTAAPSAAGAQPTAQAYPYLRNDPTDPLAIGDSDAPLVIAEWTDPRCPYCALFTNETLPIIIDEYVETGKLRIELNPVAFFGEESATAAAAALAAAEQGQYFEYLRVMYAAAPEGGKPDMPRDKLLAFAAEANVSDLAQFERDLDDPRLLERVQQFTAEAQQLGVNSVPFFAIEGEAFAGAQPIDNFRSRFDAALERLEP